MIVALTQNDLGNGIAIACGIIVLILAIGAGLAHYTRPRGRSRRYR